MNGFVSDVHHAIVPYVFYILACVNQSKEQNNVRNKKCVIVDEHWTIE